MPPLYTGLVCPKCREPKAASVERVVTSETLLVFRCEECAFEWVSLPPDRVWKPKTTS